MNGIVFPMTRGETRAAKWFRRIVAGVVLIGSGILIAATVCLPTGCTARQLDAFVIGADDASDDINTTPEERAEWLAQLEALGLLKQPDADDPEKGADWAEVAGYSVVSLFALLGYPIGRTVRKRLLNPAAPT